MTANEINTWIETLLGLGLQGGELTILQMTLRAVVIFFATLLMVRLGEKRFLGKNAAFDVILGIILGSVASRAINGSAAFVPTIVAGFVLVFLHWLLATLSFYFTRIGDLVKGQPRLLVEQGEIDRAALQKSHISQGDLLEALRTQGSLGQVERVAEARLEPSGNISVLPRKSIPQVFEVRVEAGVQVIRIEIG